VRSPGHGARSRPVQRAGIVHRAARACDVAVIPIPFAIPSARYTTGR
jgi:hypothetical protein